MPGRSSGILVGQFVDVAGVTAELPLLINVKIGNAKFSFLVNTGASISVLLLR